MVSGVHAMRVETDAMAADQPLTLESVFRDHFDEVYRVVGHLLGPSAPEADVDDVTQQVFVAVHRALPSFRGESRLSTWLYSIASNVVLTQLRSWRRQRRLVKAIEVMDVREEVARSPEDALADKRALVQVWTCLLKIKPKKRIVYVLYEIEGLSGAEIAEVLGVPESTVFTRLYHARRELSKSLESIRNARRP